jgi:hypothetical protein
MNIYSENIYSDKYLGLYIYNDLELTEVDLETSTIAIRSNEAYVANAISNNNIVSIANDPDIILPVRA